MIFGLAAVSAFLPDKAFSSNENRFFQQAPKLNADTFFSGRFSKQATDYISDQFCFRESFISLKAEVQRACGEKDIGGVYLGRDGYYFEKMTDNTFNNKQYQKNLNYVQRYFLNQNSKHCFVMLVPSAGTVLSEKLPSNAVLYDADKYYSELKNTLRNCNCFDLRETFRNNKNEYIYYKTDHHWTTDGAYFAYRNWCGMQNIKPKSRKELKFENVSDSFRGSLYSKVLLPDSAYDTVTVSNREAAVSVICDGKAMNSIYQLSELKEKDKYTVFFGGNYGQVEIETKSKNGRNLLVFKDSFANCFVPLIADQYETITMIDLRYYNGAVSDIMKTNSFSDILVLYEISNFAKDSSLYKLAF